MIAEKTDYLAAVETLPQGAALVLNDISWDDYEEILEQMESWPGVRVTYDNGKAEFISPLFFHEAAKDFIHNLVRYLADELNIPLESRGTTTFKIKRYLKGAEPDACFYVQHATDVIGRRKFEFGVTPPPDVAVEIDITNPSIDKFPIYAKLGVAELWLYDGKQARFYELSGANYDEISTSRAFPLLTATVLTEFVERSKTEGQTVALKLFRAWVRNQKQ